MTRRPMMNISSSFAGAIICSYYLSFIAIAPLVLSAVVFFILKKDLLREKAILMLMISYLMGILCFSFNAIEGMKMLLELSAYPVMWRPDFRRSQAAI